MPCRTEHVDLLSKCKSFPLTNRGRMEWTRSMFEETKALRSASSDLYDRPADLNGCNARITVSRRKSVGGKMESFVVCTSRRTENSVERESPCLLTCFSQGCWKACYPAIKLFHDASLLTGIKIHLASEAGNFCKKEGIFGRTSNKNQVYLHNLDGHQRQAWSSSFLSSPTTFCWKKSANIIKDSSGWL